MYERLILVTRKTRLEQLIERFNTRGQVKFYLEHSGGNFDEYDREHTNYHLALETLRRNLAGDLKLQQIDRSLVSTMIFSNTDVLVAVGQDGLVANTAKYIGSQPLIGVNPDPGIYDGILLPFNVQSAKAALAAVLSENAKIREVTLGEVRLNDSQNLLAFNDFFIGANSHISARYQLRLGGLKERQSSSGVIVSTGAGSTGWLSSVFNMAAGIARTFGGNAAESVRLPWDDSRLLFAVREPFKTKQTAAETVAGYIDANQPLIIESHMPANGIIFSDGIEQDFLTFNAGAVATIRPAGVRARLVVPQGS